MYLRAAPIAPEENIAPGTKTEMAPTTPMAPVFAPTYTYLNLVVLDTPVIAFGA